MTALDLRLDVEIPLGGTPLKLDLATKAKRIALDGPSGSGKSTTLRVLAGVERRARGRLSAFGETWLDTNAKVDVPAWRRGVGWCPQDALLFPHRTVFENLAYGGASRSEVEETSRLLGLLDLGERRPRNLSGGEQQRVALGRALLSRPRLLLLDEPFSALDAPLREQTVAGLVAWCDARDLPLVLASHDLGVVGALVEERYLLREGRLERT